MTELRPALRYDLLDRGTVGLTHCLQRTTPFSGKTADEECADTGADEGDSLIDRDNDIAPIPLHFYLIVVVGFVVKVSNPMRTSSARSAATHCVA